MTTNFTALLERIGRLGGVRPFCRALGITPGRWERLLCGRSEFTQAEIIRAAYYLSLAGESMAEVADRYFFGQTVQKN